MKLDYSMKVETLHLKHEKKSKSTALYYLKCRSKNTKEMLD